MDRKRADAPSPGGRDGDLAARRCAHERNDLERWARDYIASTSLAYKLNPPPPPGPEGGYVAPEHVRPAGLPSAPGRPPELETTWAKYKAPRSAAALSSPLKRAHLLHTFLHHELQAAELMCWASLAFPETPASFRRGLLQICQDEVRHMRLYAARLADLGYTVGAFPVRDWFWQRAPAAATPAAFVALMSLGFEAGNLDHCERYAALFSAAGDEDSAALSLQIGREELAHVAFGAHWFRVFCGPLAFERWRDALPAPLSPLLMRGHPLAREARREAGFDERFLDQLEAWQPS